MPSSTARPSSWVNIGEWVGSSSRRYTCPGATIRIGGGWVSIVRTWTGEVWVRSTMSSDT